MKKPWLMLVLLVVAIALLNGSTAKALPLYKDIPTDDPLYPYTKYIYDQGIDKGYPDGTFRPQGKVTRAEMAEMLAKASGLTVINNTKKSSFKDVTVKHRAISYIEAASRAGLVTGSGGYFRPDAVVNRAEAAVMILRLTKAKKPAIAISPAVRDVKSNYWAAGDIAVALDAGIFTLVEENQFQPEAPVLRADIIRALALMINYAPEKSIIPMIGQLIPVNGSVYLNGKLVSGESRCQAGSIVKTGLNSTAELMYPDGSSLLIEPNTELLIKQAKGQTTILKDGSKGEMVDYLEIDLRYGKLFGALTSLVERRDKNQIGLTSYARLAALNMPLLTSNNEQMQAWYNNPYEKKVRVQIDMPWGVCSVRGTFWTNEVNSSSENTSVADGSVEVSASGNKVMVAAGQATQITSDKNPPEQPCQMNGEDKTKWQSKLNWVEKTCSRMKEKTPVVTPPQPLDKQGKKQINKETKLKLEKTEDKGTNNHSSAEDQVNSIVNSIKKATEKSSDDSTNSSVSNSEKGSSNKGSSSKGSSKGSSGKKGK